MTTTKKNPYAIYALVILSLLNLLNYVDRYIFAGLLPYLQTDTGYSDEQVGWVMSAFTIVYTVCSPLFGYLGDRFRRGRLIALGISIWSLATAASGLAPNYSSLLVARSAVGIGEANYATIAPGLLSDFFIKARRGFVMSIFFTAIPIGSAIGFVAGGALASPARLGWRHTLFLVGLPGLLTAVAAYFMREPERGVMDEEELTKSHYGLLEGYQLLLKNRGYIFASLGYAAVTFALGALVSWAPKWLNADKGLSVETATLLLGGFVVVGGILGTMAGGAIGDWLTRRGVKAAYFWVCSASALLAMPFLFVMIASQNKMVYLASIFLGVTFVFLGNGPVNAVLVNLVPANLRTTALGFVVVIIHVLGDGISQGLVGTISTWLSSAKGNLPGLVNTLGQIFNIDPATQTLSVAMLMMPIALIVGAIFYGIGAGTKEGKQT